MDPILGAGMPCPRSHTGTDCDCWRCQPNEAVNTVRVALDRIATHPLTYLKQPLIAPDNHRAGPLPPGYNAELDRVFGGCCEGDLGERGNGAG